MNTRLAVAFLGIVMISACTSAAQKEIKEMDARGPTWPHGTYKLISVDGQSLPAELRDGRILTGGVCNLAWRGDGHVWFWMSFDYPEEDSRTSLRRRSGSVWLRQDSAVGPRIPLLFEAEVYTDLESSGPSRGFDEFPLEWRDRREAYGTLFGNELRVGDGDRYLVFMKR